MSRKRYTVEQIRVKLWEPELAFSQGPTAAQDCRCWVLPTRPTIAGVGSTAV